MEALFAQIAKKIRFKKKLNVNFIKVVTGWNWEQSTYKPLHKQCICKGKINRLSLLK